MHVLVSGSSGHLARALLPGLCAIPSIDRVTGVDRSVPWFEHAKFRTVTADIADPVTARALRGVDAFVHLAFRLLRGRLSPEAMREANVVGSQRVLTAAADADVGGIIHVSSAAVYGSGANLTESAGLRPLPDFLYARQKAAVETWIASNLPNATVMRPHIVLGPHALPVLKSLVASRCYVRLPEPQPQLQCVHEEDVAAAICLAVERPVAGPLNLAAPLPFTVRDMVRHRRPYAVGLPFRVAHAGLTAAWRIAGWGGEPGWLEGVRHTLTLDCTRARDALGWRPRYCDWRDIAMTS